MHSKGLVYTLLTAFFVVGILIFVLYIGHKIIKENGFLIGNAAVGVINIVENSQLLQTTIQQEAKITAFETIRELHKNGGFSDTSGSCGVKEEIVYWNDRERFCTPTVQLEFYKLLKTKLNKKLIETKLTNGVKLPENNYDFYIENNYLYGLAIMPLKITDKQITYYFRPWFLAELPYDFDTYKQLKKIVETCLVQTEKAKECIEIEFRQKGIPYLYQKEDNNYIFNILFEGSQLGHIQPLQFGLILLDVSSDTNK